MSSTTNCRGSNAVTRHGKHAIRVIAAPSHLPHYRAGGLHWFAYHITIRNEGTAAAQLLTRHWRIIDGDNHTREINGDGVVGEQPIIAAGAEHAYTSHVNFPTPIGVMEGRYTFQTPTGDRFQATIDRFILRAIPRLH